MFLVSFLSDGLDHSILTELGTFIRYPFELKLHSEFMHMFIVCFKFLHMLKICICVCRLFNYSIGIHLLQSEDPGRMPKTSPINPKDNHISFQVYTPIILDQT